MLTPREQLIQRLLELDDDRLADITRYLDSLECGVSSPLSVPSIPSTGASEGSQGNESDDESSHSKDWPHAPVHRLSEHGTFIVTAGTYHKQHFFRGPDRLTLLESKLLAAAKRFGWQLEAWAVFSNHYHFVAHALPDCGKLGEMLKSLHAETAIDVNQADSEPGREVWYNYWDTELTFEKSYLARLNYVHQNAVRHGLVRVANQYRWCSAAWFERTASRAQVSTIYSFKTGKVKVIDDFEPVLECDDSSSLSFPKFPFKSIQGDS
jgi:putative transposase